MWPHPEVLSFALVAIALALSRPAAARRPRSSRAALASLQNPPARAARGGLLWARPCSTSWRSAPARPMPLGAPSPGCRRSLPAAFFQWQFGVFNLSVRPSEAAESLSWRCARPRPRDRPQPGPAPARAAHRSLLGVLAGRSAAAAARRRLGRRCSSSSCCRSLAFACTANSNWNNDTSGPSRYVVWMLPLLAFVAAGGDRRSARMRPLGALRRLGPRPRARPRRPRPSSRAAGPLAPLRLPRALVGGASRARPLGPRSTVPPRRSSSSARCTTRARSRGRSSTATRPAAAARPGCSGATRRRSSPRCGAAARGDGRAARGERAGARRSATGPTWTTDGRRPGGASRPRGPSSRHSPGARSPRPRRPMRTRTSSSTVVAHRGAHPPHLAVLALGQDDLEPGRGPRSGGPRAPRGVPSTRTRAGRVSVPSSRGSPSRSARSASLVRHAGDARVVGLRHVVRRGRSAARPAGGRS